MKMALILYKAGRTSGNNEVCAAFAKSFGAELETLPVLAGETLQAALGGALQSAQVVLLCGGEERCRAQAFEYLRVPVTADGKPEGVRSLIAGRANGWLVESERQAVALLPDIPKTTAALLEQAAPRIAEKFGLSRSLPAGETLDFEEAVEACADRLLA